MALSSLRPDINMDHLLARAITEAELARAAEEAGRKDAASSHYQVVSKYFDLLFESTDRAKA